MEQRSFKLPTDNPTPDFRQCIPLFGVEFVLRWSEVGVPRVLARQDGLVPRAHEAGLFHAREHSTGDLGLYEEHGGWKWAALGGENFANASCSLARCFGGSLTIPRNNFLHPRSARLCDFSRGEIAATNERFSGGFPTVRAPYFRAGHSVLAFVGLREELQKRPLRFLDVGELTAFGKLGEVRATVIGNPILAIDAELGFGRQHGAKRF